MKLVNAFIIIMLLIYTAVIFIMAALYEHHTTQSEVLFNVEGIECRTQK